MAQEKQPISIVTDSTADLPPELAEQCGIDVIPMVVAFGNQAYRDRVDIGIQQFLDKLQVSEELPTTGAPSESAYLEVYQRHPGNILSVHVGSKFSRVIEGAIKAANTIGEDRIHPLDSGTVSLGLGFMAVEAAQLAEAGYSLEQITKQLDNFKDRTIVVAALQTLEFLKKGGRASSLEASLGSLLQIKPIIEVDHNQLRVLEKPRTRKRSLNRLVEIARDHLPLERVGVMHADAEAEAFQVADQINDLTKGNALMVVTEIGSVVATHAGPGVVGLGLVQEPREKKA